jgi:transposase
LILLLDKGATFATIRAPSETTNRAIIRWKERVRAQGLGGLGTSNPGQRAYRLTPSLRAKVLNATRKKPSDGATHWSCRTHLNPPQHAAVFCIDEKGAIQALDRLDLVLLLSPGRAERRGCEYYRHGTLSLYAALDTQTGKVHGKTATRHTSAEFVRFLEEVVSSRPAAQETHIIVDNLSVHKTKRVRGFLEDHSNVHLYFTPTYSSWLNQVEIWFSRIEREVISRDVFSSVSDLARKSLHFTRTYSAHAKPFKWKYSDPSRHLGNLLFATSVNNGSLRAPFYLVLYA